MTVEMLYEALGDVRADYVAAACAPRRKKTPAWVKWAALAACVCLSILAAVTLLSPDGDELPDVPPTDFSGVAMGFEGVLAYDMADYHNGNPWNGAMSFDTLPVYKNSAYNPVGLPVGLAEADMTARLERACVALGLGYYDVELIYEGETLIGLTAKGEPTVTVEADGSVEVEFTTPITLPEEYPFARHDISEADAARTLRYLAEKFAPLLDMAQPQTALEDSYIIWNDYDEEGNALTKVKRDYAYRLYDGSGDDLQDILNYAYRFATFSPNDEGKLWLIRLYDGLSCAEKLGDYPAITIDEARELLGKGNYVSSVPYEVDTDLIRREELAYRYSPTDETFLPYYRFYVELPELRREDGLTDFGVYYVPAIAGEYLTDLPQWDGRFN